MTNWKFGVVFFIFSLAGCAHTPPPVVQEAKGQEFVSAIGMTCSDPWKLKQDCSGLSGPTREIEIHGQPMKIAASDDGKVVIIFGDGEGSTAATSNNAFEIVKREFAKRDIAILKVRPIASLGQLFGYGIETDQDAYTVLLEISRN